MSAQSNEHRRWSDPPRTTRWLLIMKKAFEAEDAADVPDIFHVHKVSELTRDDRVSLHQRLQGCRKLGRGPQLPANGGQHFTIEGRTATFIAPWTGPSIFVMAECGLIKVTSTTRTLTNWARCYCCDVTFRELPADVCMWTLHRQLSPNCRHLQRARAHGTKARNVGLLARRFSMNSSMGER